MQIYLRKLSEAKVGSDLSKWILGGARAQAEFSRHGGRVGLPFPSCPISYRHLMPLPLRFYRGLQGRTTRGSDRVYPVPLAPKYHFDKHVSNWIQSPVMKRRARLGE